MDDNKKPLIPIDKMMPIGIGFAAAGLFGILVSILLRGVNDGIFITALILCFGLPSIIGWTAIVSKILHDRGVRVFPDQIIDNTPPKKQTEKVKTCPSCGVENPPDNNFCMQCGSKL